MPSQSAKKEENLLGCRDTVCSLSRQEATLVLDKGINIVTVDRLVWNVVVSYIVNLSSYKKEK